MKKALAWTILTSFFVCTVLAIGTIVFKNTPTRGIASSEDCSSTYGYISREIPNK